jgi:amino acid permease
VSGESILGSIGISRDELLDGMPARRASTIVFAIENLTLQLVARSRRALVRYQPAETARDKERQFMDAVSAGREPSARPAIQDVERYAADWRPMVPEVADTRAAILHQMSTRYALYYDRVPRIRGALGVDTQAVADAYRRQQHADISTAFVSDIDWRERIRWWRARVSERLETMPPFWMAFSLTLTETVGGGMLAIPIALAGVGVPVGLVLLGLFGLISITTVAALVEGITRDGTMRYGNGYFGQLVENRLGRPGGVAIGASMFALNGVGLFVALIGFGTVLAQQTGVSALIWVGLLFAAILIVLRRENLDATIAAALLVGIVILGLAAGMIALGLLHVQPDLLAGAGSGQGSEPGGTSVVALVFGVLLYVYFGHTSAGNAARQVLRRDPSGRTLLWGNVAAMAVAAVIYWLFVIAVNGSVPASRLAEETGTAVTPLAEVAGPVVGVLGSIYVILSLGLGAIFMSLGLYLQTVEQVSPRDTMTGWLRFSVAAAPVVAIFLLMEVLLFLGATSFTGPLSLVGALILPLLGGVFPMLIIAAARRRGERVPGTRLGWLGNPAVVTAVIVLYLGGIVAQGLLIWTNPVERIAAAATTAVMLALIAISVRRGSFAPRTVVELRADEPPGAGMDVSAVAAGTLVSAAERRIDDLAAQGAITVDVPPVPPELFVWAHRPTRDGDTEPLDVTTEVDGAGEVVVRPEARWLPST